VAGAIAGALGTRPELLAGTLAARRLLLVLDNFEHVIDAAPVLAELLGAAPELRILVTSQAPLRLVEEQTYLLAGLGEASAADLLLARARRVSHGFAGDDETIAELCRELDGSPLGIELAAARLALLSPGDLLERLRRSPDALGTGGRNLPERQRGLRAAMQWSYGLLDPQAASLFRRLGHFAGEASLERIEQVCPAGVDDVLESLAQLVDLSLVRRTRDGQFEVASALRTYSRELLDASGERDELCRRHAESIISALSPLVLEPPLMSPADDIFRMVLAELSDVLMLIEWASSADGELFGGLIACTFGPLRGTGGMARWHQRIIDVAESGVISGRVLTNVRIAALHTGQRRAGFLDLALATPADDDPLYGAWLRGMMVVMDALAHPPADWLARARAVATDLAASVDPGLQHLAGVVDGHLLLLEERFDEAADAFEANLAGGSASWSATTAVYMVGDCHLFAGRPETAIPAYVRGFLHARNRTVRIDMGFQAEGIACALSDVGRHEAALQVLGASDTLTGESVRPRELDPFWGGVTEPRVQGSRQALGPVLAEAAYERGRGLGPEAVVELVMSYASPVGSVPGA
jgi:hypothetical protein